MSTHCSVCVSLNSLFYKCSRKLKRLWVWLRRCEFVNKGNDDGVDRISAMPEPILQHIMSFLPFKQIVKTCLVSKKWQQAWLTLPILEFDDSVLILDLWCGSQYNKEKALEIRRKRKKVFDHLKKLLENRLREFVSTEKFILSLEITNDQDVISFIDQCISYVIESNVKELNLDFLSWGSRWYHLPQIVFSANSIQELELKGCKLELPRSNVKLNSLRKLSLRHVYADDRVVENLLGGCPLIEDLVLSTCRGFKIIEILNQCKLKEIKLMNNGCELQKMEIKAWNVHSIEIYDLTENCEINITSCKNLKSLKLSHLLISDEWLLNQISQLPNLEFLSIIYCIELQSFRISSPSLKSLVIDRCINMDEIKIETPILRLFKYEGDTISFSSNGSTLVEIDIFFYSKNINTLRYAKYIDLLAKFNDSSVVLKLQSQTGENIIIPRELRQILPPPLPNVKHLNFKINHNFTRYAIARVLDGLLWISPHVETISIEYGTKKYFFKITYKEQVIFEGEIACCCKSLPVSCWRRCIKQVRIEDSEGNNEKRCFIVSKDIPKKIDDICG